MRKIDTTKDECPVPLTKTRKALKEISIGDEIEIIGFDPVSKEEIQFLESKDILIKSVSENEEGLWKIVLRKVAE